MATMPEPEYKVVSEAGEKVLRINYEGLPYSPSLENDPVIFSQVFNILLEAGKVSRIVFVQREEFEYDWPQVSLILELVDAYNKLVKEDNILALTVTPACSRYLPEWTHFLRDALLQRFKGDPIGAYVSLVRRRREETIKQKSPPTADYISCAKPFVNALEHAIATIKASTLIKHVEDKLEGFEIGDRSLYKAHFRPSMRPRFVYTKLVTAYPAGAEELASYKIAEDTEVLVLKSPVDIRPIYQIMPPEFRLSEEKYALLTEAREVMSEHRPQRSEFIDPKRTREIFFAIERDLIEELARNKGLKLRHSEIEELARILLRYTLGFGLVEVVLSDPAVQDLVVNAPLGTAPISIIHGEFGECRTNITPLPREGESWATKLRLISGRPFDEANPVLDTSLLLPYARARVAALQRPLSPAGYSFAFRRHRDRAWTLPLFIKNKMLTPLAAGLASFLADGARTMLIAGTRSSGKTSLLGALLVEISRNNRIITSEDTLELPVAQLRNLGYDILSMKTRSVITGAEAEVPAEQAIRTALRLGDSALIVGEIRSVEARALWEAMRVGALAKVVAGTIHGASPYDVYDRVVNDLGVPKTSFKATDVIMVANIVTSPSGLERYRRLVEIAEVRKLWTEDPLAEKGFADLMKYNAATDKIEPTDVLVEGESEVIKAVGARVREWAGNWNAIWENIELRAKLKEALVNAEAKTKKREILEAPFVVKANDEFHKISARVAEEVGFTDPKRVYDEWSYWLKQAVKKIKK